MVKTEAIVLAAGYSSRAGTFKLAVRHEGKPMLHYTIDALLPYTENIYVVGGYKIELVEELLRQYDDHVVLVENMDYDCGMFSSIKSGMKYIQSRWFYVTPGDCPMIASVMGLMQEQIDCIERTASVVDMLIPTCRGRGGHPVALHERSRSVIDNMPKEASMKQYRDTLPAERILRMETGIENILIDFDTVDELKRW